MSDLWIGAWIACLVTGVVVWGLIGYCIVRFRRRRDDEIPRQLRYHLPIEMLYTVAPLIVVAVFFFFTVEKQDKMLADVAHPDHQVIVTAQQWSWTFNYLRRVRDRRHGTSTTPGRRPVSRSCGWSRTSRSTSSCTRPT